MPAPAGDGQSPKERVRTAEVIASLCLATDLGMGFPFEHGLAGSVCRPPSRTSFPTCRRDGTAPASSAAPRGRTSRSRCGSPMSAAMPPTNGCWLTTTAWWPRFSRGRVRRSIRRWPTRLSPTRRTFSGRPGRALGVGRRFGRRTRRVPHLAGRGGGPGAVGNGSLRGHRVAASDRPFNWRCGPRGTRSRAPRHGRSRCHDCSPGWIPP